MKYEEILNKEQINVVNELDGPVLVFAGAGSGKTRCLTYRIANLIDHGVAPDNILAITFTNKATNEMKDRLFSILHSVSKHITISTFHAFCSKILRENIFYLNMNINFTIIDDDDEKKIIKSILNDFDSSIDYKKAYKSIKFCKTYNYIPEKDDYKDIYFAYDQYLTEHSYLDFEDLLCKTFDLFCRFSNVLKIYQERYKYILIDEFQDTNRLQYEIIKKIGAFYKNIFVVGDDDQSIYSFRGTNFENLYRFKDEFQAKELFLVNNYRSTFQILQTANKLISHNKNRVYKNMQGVLSGTSNDVIYFSPYNDKIETRFILDNILINHSLGVDYKNIAVLYRINALSRNIESELIKAKIPYNVYGGLSYFARSEVKDILSFFKILINPNDTVSFERVLKLLGIKKVKKIIEMCNVYPIQQVIENENIVILQNLFNYYKNANCSVIDFYNTVYSMIDFDNILKCNYKNYEDRIKNLKDLSSMFMIDNNNKSLNDNLYEILTKTFLDDVPSPSNFGLTLSTIHSAKGLEFDVVFLIGLEEGIFPDSSFEMTDEQMEEERRLCYVGITRAKKRLYVLSNKSRILYGKFNYYQESRFIAEMRLSKEVLYE